MQEHFATTTQLVKIVRGLDTSAENYAVYVDLGPLRVKSSKTEILRELKKGIIGMHKFRYSLVDSRLVVNLHKYVW